MTIWKLFQRKQPQELSVEAHGVVWMCEVNNWYELGNKPGTRTKFYGRDWDPAEFNLPLSPEPIMNALRRYGQGYSLTREEFPEAVAVWNEKRFSSLSRDLFFAAGFYAIQGKLAEVLSRFDLGEGGLIPFPVYKADLETPYPGEFFLLNFGCIKNTFLPERSGDARKFLIRKATGQQVWHVNDLKLEAEVVLASQALDGPDLWFEEAVHNKIFMSDALALALIENGMGGVFRLHRCRVVAVRKS